jgi:hypothetical protein
MMGVLVENPDAAWIPPPKKKWIRHYYLSKCGVCLLRVRVISLCFACENAHRRSAGPRRRRCQSFLLRASCCRLAGCEILLPGQRFLWPRPAFRKVCEKNCSVQLFAPSEAAGRVPKLAVHIYECEFNLQPI